MFNENDFESLQETSMGGNRRNPEDDIFHAIYIPGMHRKNEEKGITEKSGFLQIRGVAYNLEEIYGVIIHTKEILIKSIKNPITNRDETACFSYKNKTPWMGTSGRRCGKNTAERATNDFCADCKSHLLVAFIYCDKDGNFILDDNGEKIYMFIRAKGIKYPVISKYIMEISKIQDDFPKVFPNTIKGKNLDILLAKSKFVTQIGMDTVNTNHGPKLVFTLTQGETLPVEKIKEAIGTAKSTLEKFNMKFDQSLYENASGGTSEELENSPEENITTSENSLDLSKMQF